MYGKEYRENINWLAEIFQREKERTLPKLDPEHIKQNFEGFFDICSKINVRYQNIRRGADITLYASDREYERRKAEEQKDCALFEEYCLPRRNKFERLRKLSLSLLSKDEYFAYSGLDLSVECCELERHHELLPSNFMMSKILTTLKRNTTKPASKFNNEKAIQNYFADKAAGKICSPKFKAKAVEFTYADDDIPF